MWKKTLFLLILFYFFALLQGSFFIHFSLFGAVPNLVFALFFILAFFEGNSVRNQWGSQGHTPHGYWIFIWAVVAGFFLDVLSYTYIGVSIATLVILGFLLKKTQSLLKNKADNYPFVYFLPLFLIFFTLYEFSLMAFVHFFDSSHAIISLDFNFLTEIIYNGFIASVFFCIYKKWRKYTK